MKKSPGIVLVLLITVILVTAGCTSQPAPAAPVQPTPEPSVPATSGTPVMTLPIPQITNEVTTTPPVTPMESSPPPADPTDVTRIKFLHYSDSDFSVDYPSTWIITHSTYTPYYCVNDTYVYNRTYHVCYENETRSIGPLNFHVNDNLVKPYRIVMFTSADGRLKFVVSTSDFINSLNGYFRLDPTIEWIKNEFQLTYPDLAASSYVGNYRYFRSGNAMVSSWDVRLPEGSGYSPTAYTEEAVVTVHHFYRFLFIADNTNFDRYYSLKERMISSITTNDVA
jgi:hypothetical protein